VELGRSPKREEKERRRGKEKEKRGEEEEAGGLQGSATNQSFMASSTPGDHGIG